jgi:hypothetical protein
LATGGVACDGSKNLLDGRDKWRETDTGTSQLSNSFTRLLLMLVLCRYWRWLAGWLAGWLDGRGWRLQRLKQQAGCSIHLVTGFTLL